MALTEKYVSSLAGGSGNGLSEGAAYTFTQMVNEIMASSGTGGRGFRYNIKADGTYSRSGDEVYNGASGTTASPIAMRGYKTTPGDGWLGRDSIGNLITTNMPTVFYNNGIFVSPRYCSMETIRWTGSKGDYIFKADENVLLNGCYVENTSTSGNVGCGLSGAFSLSFECDFILTGTGGGSDRAVMLSGDDTRFHNCRFINNSPNAKGISGEPNLVMTGCLLKGPAAATTAAVLITSDTRQATIVNCTIDRWKYAVRYENATEQRRALFLHGNMITDCSDYAVYSTYTNLPYFIGANRFRDCAGIVNVTNDWGVLTNFYPPVTTDTGGAETDYVDVANNNYNLIAASPAKNANAPKWAELGAYGIAVGTGPALVSVFHPLLPQIIRPAPSD